MTEVVDGYASYAPKTYLCALGMHKRTAQLVQKRHKKPRKGCCVKRKMRIDKFRLGDYDRAKLKTLEM